MPRSRGRKRKASRSYGAKSGSPRPARPAISLRRYRVQRAAGWTLVGLGAVLGISHWLAHLGAWSFATPGVMDLVAGYPLAGALGLTGVLVLTKS